MKTNRKKILDRFLQICLCIISTAAGIIFLELGLRMFYPFPFGYVQGGVEADSELCYKLPENFNATIHTLDAPYSTRFTTTAFGTRTTGTYAENSSTILVLGDSFTQAIQVNDEETFSSVLNKKLRKTGKNYNILNYGALGYNPYQYLAVLNKTITQFKTKYVILNFYTANDFVLPADDIRKGCPITVIDGYLMTANASERSWLFMLRQFSHHNTHTYNFLTSKLSSQPIKKFLYSLKLSTNNPDSPEAQLFVQNENSDKYFENTFSVLETINQITRAQNATFILVIIPARYHLVPELWGKFWKQYGLTAQPDILLPYKKIAQYGLERNITVINLYDIFSQNHPAQYYGLRDDHYNSKGHQKHAELILKALQK